MYPVRRIHPGGYTTPGSNTTAVSYLALAGSGRRIAPIALVSSDIIAFVLSVFLAFALGVAALPSPFERAIGNLTRMGTAWHGWETLLVFVSVLGFFTARGHYTSRVPFWTQLHDVIMAAAIGLTSDTFLTVAVYDRPVAVEGLLRWFSTPHRCSCCEARCGHC